MKFKKKTAMLVSFTLGTLLVATTALADIVNKSGYDQLKDALKVTAEQSSEKFDSYTMDFSVAMKDNGKTLMTENEIQKYDRSKSASENISSGISIRGEKNSSQNYSDKKTQIRVTEGDPTYYVTEFTKEREDKAFTNPFKEDEAEDIEKIVDAVVGSLKDHVVVTNNPDGSKGFAGSLTEVQIPPLVNAVASFALKEELNNGREDNLPHLTKDVFVKEVKGTAKVNKDGVMENILGTVVFSGKDDKGTAHDISVEVLAKLSGINSTKVTKPDLTGKKVITNTANNEDSGSEIAKPEKFVGKFHNDILIEKDGKFVKAGERILVIAHFDNKSVAGQYTEEYKPGFEDYAKNKRDFKFDAKKSEEKNSSGFDITTESGTKGDLYINGHDGKIEFHMNNSSTGGVQYDSTFSPDLD
jgi:hypothetical protein